MHCWNLLRMNIMEFSSTTPLLARSVSAAGRLGPDPSPVTHSYVPQSYRNATIGNSVSSSSSGFSYPHSSFTENSSPAYSQLPTLVSSPMFLLQNSVRLDVNSVKSGFSFGMGNRTSCRMLHNGQSALKGMPAEARIVVLPCLMTFKTLISTILYTVDQGSTFQLSFQPVHPGIRPMA